MKKVRVTVEFFDGEDKKESWRLFNYLDTEDGPYNLELVSKIFDRLAFNVSALHKVVWKRYLR